MVVAEPGCAADPGGALGTWAFSSSISCCRMRSFSSVLWARAFVATPQAQDKANANAVFFIVAPSQVGLPFGGWLVWLRCRRAVSSEKKSLDRTDRASRT